MNPIPASGSSGLQADPHPALTSGVTYVLNGRVETGGAADGLWSNEPANELAFVLPVGKSVVTTLLLTELSRTLVFLAGPISEIGWVSHVLRPEAYTNHGFTYGEETKSEPFEPERSPLGTYNTLLTAPCLDFRSGVDLVVRYQFVAQDLYLYLADGIHAVRVLRFTVGADDSLTLHTDNRVITGLDSCQAPIYGTTLDCTRSRLDPLMDTLNLSVQGVQVGGSWEAGSVQFRAAYSTPTGERLTEFTAGTGYVSIWEDALATRSGQATSQSVTLKLESNSNRFTHIVIGILQVIGNQTKTFVTEPYPVSAGTIVLRGTETRLPLALNELLETRVHYETAVGLATTEDRLLQYGLREKPVGNLQKFFLTVPVQWETIQLPEGSYRDPVVAERFKGYMRDEVVGLGLVLQFDDGDETGVIHLPGRAPTPADAAPSTTVDAQVVQYVEKATTVPTWRVLNTATVTASPYVPYTSPDNPGSWRVGNMGYWESTVKYPNRPDVWGPLCGQPIRHHRMPDSTLTHIHDGLVENGVVTPLVKAKNLIYPLGIRVDAGVIRTAIQQAETAGELPVGRVTGWRVVRADRTGQASILARGLLFDVNQYQRKGKTVFYPNYPFNDLRADPLLTADPDTYKKLGVPVVPMPFTRSDTYTFHSPDSSFNQVGKAQYLKVETEEFGMSEGQYVEAEGQGKVKLPTQAISQASFDLALASQGKGGIFGSSLPANPFLAILQALGESQTFRTLFMATVPFKNYGYQYVGVGWYNQWKVATTLGNRLRPIGDQALMQPKIQQIGGKLINNQFRESSIFISVDTGTTTPPRFPLIPPTVAFDLSRWIVGDQAALDINKTLYKSVASYYASLKVAQPAQYGRISGIQYLETGKLPTLVSQSGPVTIFGGDTFINRFSVKRKHSFFSQTGYGLQNGADINYALTPNVAYPVYFYNTSNAVLNDGAPSSGAIGATVAAIIGDAAARLDLDQSKLFYKDGVVYLYSYGIPYFFCESSVNVDLREAQDLQEGGFFPLVDPQSWTQEAQVSINLDNKYDYDRSYSHPLRENKLLAYPDSQKYNDLADQWHPNRVIWSEIRNWRYYKALNSYDFDRKNGLLVSLDGLEARRVLARFENGSALFNAYSTIQTSQDTALLGNGGLFAQPPQEFAQADGGLLGSQHKTFIQTPFGYVWVDARRGAVYLLEPGGSPIPLHPGPMEHWLGRHIPSQLLTEFPTVPDNKTSIRLVYDSDNHRLILTRHDLYLKKKGLTYNPVTDQFRSGSTVVNYGDANWFGDNSWTASYHFPTKQWGFLSFTPSYLLPWPDGFVSLLNSPNSSLKGSGWIHRNSRLQYQRFFGRLFPFEIRYQVPTGPQHLQLQSLEYSHDVRRYHQADQYVQVPNRTLDSLVVTTEYQSSGVVPLKPGNFNRMQDLIQQGPRLTQQPGGSWTVNGISDQTQNHNSLPLWITSSNGTRQWVNQKALRVQDGIRIHSPVSGRSFTVHFTQYSTDKYQFVHQWVKPLLIP